MLGYTTQYGMCLQKSSCGNGIQKSNSSQLVLIYKIIVTLCYRYGGFKTRCICKFLGSRWQLGIDLSTFGTSILCLVWVLGQKQGRRHKFLTGGGQILVNQNHLPPNSDFSLHFGHFILEILEYLKILTNMHNFFFKSRFLGGHPSRNFELGGTRLRHPPQWQRPWSEEYF